MQPQSVLDTGWSHGQLPMSPNGEWDDFAKFWEDLPADPYVKQTHQTARYRRLGRLLARGGKAAPLEAAPLEVERLPHGSFFQSEDVNSVYGGVARTFAPITPETYDSTHLRVTLGQDLFLIRQIAGEEQDWLITIHLIRVCADGDRRSAPAPEGRHSDGHDYVIMHLVGRHFCIGGKSRVYRKGIADPVQEFTLTHPMETIAIDDRMMEHEVTPIGQSGSAAAARDMMIVDFDRFDADPGPRSTPIPLSLF
jgi:hypothetical protein